MRLRSTGILTCAGLVLLSQAPMAGAVSLIPMDEPVTNLVAPPVANPHIPTMKYTYAGVSFVATTVTSTPLYCANTDLPQVTGTTLNPVFYSANAIGSTTPRPFVFGAAAQTPSVSLQAFGATKVKGDATAMHFSGDANGSLVCYGVDSNGVRRITRNLFADGSEPANFNSSVSLSVFHMPTSNSDYYGYKVDVTLPALPNATDYFALVEGFDSSVFATTAGEATSGIQGTWCPTIDGSTCYLGQSAGNINYSAFNGYNSSLQAPVLPNGAVQYHFIVKRYLRQGVSYTSLPSAPLAVAVLFSPSDLEENKLDDNVSVGNNQLANSAPSVVTNDGAWSSFVGSVGSLAENSDSGALTFNILDADSGETGGTLHATASLVVNGLQVAVTPNCALSASQPAPPAVARTCTIDIPLNNPSFWDAGVAANYDGLFNALATDTTDGNYASGVSASARIVAIDALGKSSAEVVLPVHVHSTANNPPTLAFGGALVSAVDPNNFQTYSTYSCSVALGGAAGGCGLASRGAIEVNLAAVASATPGPAAAFDELAAQTTAVVPFVDPQDAFTNVRCDREQQALVFASSGGPIFTPSSGGNYDVDFLLPTTPPASTVSALCTLTITDAGTFPNGQTAATVAKVFRIAINP